MNIIETIRIKLKRWLLEEELQDIRQMRLNLANVQHNYEHAMEEVVLARNSYYDAKTSYTIARDMVARCLDMGVDIGVRDRSWAVVCIGGKVETVRFMRLNDENAKEIRMFLRHFAASNLIVDTPISYRGYFGLDEE